MCSLAKPPQATALSGAGVLKELRCFIGKWKGKGRGVYPTLSAFQYEEEISFEHFGKPYLYYTQKTWNPVTHELMHVESGYANVRPEGRVTMTISDPTGLAHVYEGSVAMQEDESLVLTLETTIVGKTSWAKPVNGVRRTIHIDPTRQKMSYTLDMAAMGQPMQLHLDAHLTKMDPAMISANAVKQETGPIAFIDVREAAEREANPPITGSLEIPLGQLIACTGNIESPIWKSINDVAEKNKLLVCVCGSGKRAMIAAEKMREALKTDNVVALEGGVKTWSL